MLARVGRLGVRHSSRSPPLLPTDAANRAPGNPRSLVEEATRRARDGQV